MAMHSRARAWCCWWWWVWVWVRVLWRQAWPVEGALSLWLRVSGGAEKKGPSRRLKGVREPERRQLGGLGWVCGVVAAEGEGRGTKAVVTHARTKGRKASWSPDGGQPRSR